MIFITMELLILQVLEMHVTYDNLFSHAQANIWLNVLRGSSYLSPSTSPQNSHVVLLSILKVLYTAEMVSPKSYNAIGLKSKSKLAECCSFTTSFTRYCQRIIHTSYLPNHSEEIFAGIILVCIYLFIMRKYLQEVLVQKTYT